MNSAQVVHVLRRLRQAAHAGTDAVSDAQLLARYTGGQDQSAFATLVARHGPMVLGVCRSVLHNWHDAEDAFQATFLVLARNPAAIRKEGSLASYLYGVAYRVSLRARTGAARQRARERRASEPSSADPLLDMTVREVRQVLHEELQQLPQKYRAPLVLCYLEGLSQEEAANQLGWSPGATRGRLDRGREQLRKRLARRGLTLSAGLGAASLGTTDPLPAVLPGSASANASRLADGMLQALLVSKLKTFSALLLLVVLLTAGTGWLVHAALAVGPSRETAPGRDDPGTTTFAGRVLDPAGKPVAGARVYLTHHDSDVKGNPTVQAVTTEAGRFRFTRPRHDSQGERITSVFATADGFGPAWLVRADRAGEITLRLVKDDVPVTGRILNLEGKPVAGVTVRVSALKSPPGGSLTPWLQAVKERPGTDGLSLDYQYLPMFYSRELAGVFPTITTRADGRFTLRGIGRERAVALLVEGPTIETKEINVLTRTGVPTITVPWYRNAPDMADLVYYPARFDHAAAPCRTVTGSVRDRATGKPIAGAIVRTERPLGNPSHHLQALTERNGRYRLTGLPGGRSRPGLDTLVVLPGAGQVYVAVRKPLPSRDRIEPGRVDFELERGVWIEGRVTDRATGEGVEAQLRYNVFVGDRPEAEERSLYLPPYVLTDNQGRFRFVGVPGRALLGARAWGAQVGRFRIGVGAERIEGRENQPGGLGTTFRTYPEWVMAINHDALLEVKPAKGATRVRCELKLDPGRKQTVRILDGDGKTLSGTRVSGQFARRAFEQPLAGSECTVHALTAGEPRTLFFLHEGKKLAGRLVVKGSETGPVEVRLQPAGTLAGRLVDARGRPLRYTDVRVYYQYGERNVLNPHASEMTTDAEGRFRLGPLVPDVRYVGHVPLKGKLYPGVAFDLSLKAGESRDLGDVQPRVRAE